MHNAVPHSGYFSVDSWRHGVTQKLQDRLHCSDVVWRSCALAPLAPGAAAAAAVLGYQSAVFGVSDTIHHATNARSKR